ncbi:hypothetical protein QCE63_04390 [Caballeronia sp. LZ065]|uniref:hypothetical protein n=1 Tax=Caballeronia sp. LZ065 TaxID=3038571 RepID=UPI00285E5E61|nr:hypothetical protein [Caballeronia sp. LZ065]MDR5778670.1 hypothetical protein [Caballeronia sp. LZ065]
MLNIVLGFFREYAPVIIGCAFMQFCVPGLVDWFYRVVLADDLKAAAKGKPSKDAVAPSLRSSQGAAPAEGAFER